MAVLPPNFKPGDWMCPEDNTHNFRSRTQCMRCGLDRGEADSRPQGRDHDDRGYDRRGGRDRYDDRGDRGGRYFREDRDPRDNHSRSPPRRTPPNFKPGDWMCDECDAHNFSRRDTCMRCSNERPMNGGGNSGGRYNDRGDRGDRYGGGRDGGYGGDRYGDRGGRADNRPPNFKPGDWMCPNCDAHNFRSRTQCMKCSTSKDEATGGYNDDYRGGSGYNDRGGSGYNDRGGRGGGRGGLPPNFKPGDWMCPDCNYHNFRSNSQCKRCGTSAPGDGGSPRGSKRSGDYEDHRENKRTRFNRDEDSEDDDDRRR